MQAMCHITLWFQIPEYNLTDLFIQIQGQNRKHFLQVCFLFLIPTIIKRLSKSSFLLLKVCKIRNTLSAHP